MTILLPIEIKDRELHAKIFLAAKIIENSKFDVVIGKRIKFIIYLSTIQTFIFYLKVDQNLGSDLKKKIWE